MLEQWDERLRRSAYGLQLAGQHAQLAHDTRSSASDIVTGGDANEIHDETSSLRSESCARNVRTFDHRHQPTRIIDGRSEYTSEASLKGSVPMKAFPNPSTSSALTPERPSHDLTQMNVVGCTRLFLMSHVIRPSGRSKAIRGFAMGPRSALHPSCCYGRNT